VRAPLVDVEEKLERIERLLREVLERLERLERLAGLRGEEARIAVELAALITRPVGNAVAAIARAAAAVDAMRRFRVDDPISRAIVEALAVHGTLTLRGLEREVRRLRGRASRSTIRERLRALESVGVVRVERRGRRLLASLAVEEPSDAGGGGEAPSGGSHASVGLPGAEAEARGGEEGLAAKVQGEGEEAAQGAEKGAGGGVRGGPQRDAETPKPTEPTGSRRLAPPHQTTG
jgi:hypothetical protein